VIILVVLISLLPGFIGWYRARTKSVDTKPAPGA
jgi:hypothetical protein